MSPILPPLWDAVLGNASQGSALLVYFFVNPYRLQPVALASAVSQVVFFLLQRPPVLIFAFWDFLQACINATQVVKLFYLDAAPVSFSERELLALSLAQRCFDAVPSRKIARVLRRCGAAWVTVAPGDTVALLDRGESERLYFVVEGGAGRRPAAVPSFEGSRVTVALRDVRETSGGPRPPAGVDAFNADGVAVFQAHPGSFVGEASLSHAVAGTRPCEASRDVADVAVARADGAEGATCLAWPVRALARALRGDAELLDAFREAVAIDLYAKMEREESVARSSAAPAVVPTDSRRGRRTTGFRALVAGLFARKVAPASPPARPRAGSMRRRRADSLRAVVDFVRGESSERATLYRQTLSFDALEAPPPRRRTESAAARDAAATTRPAADAARDRRARRSLRARHVLAGVAVAAFLVGVALDASSVVGNGSQVLITGSFAIDDMLALFLVSFLGTSLQACFFYFRPPRIWSSFVWSAAQAAATGAASAYLALERYRSAAPPRPFSDRELFAARVLQRAGGLQIDAQHLAELLAGGDALAPTWDVLAPGELLPSHRVGLLCDGAAVVTRPEDGSTRVVPPGSLLHGDLLAQHLDAAPEAAAASPRAPPKRRRSFSPPPVGDVAADLSTATAVDACEVLAWDLAELVAFLGTRRDARLCVNALISSAKLEAYMSLDKDV